MTSPTTHIAIQRISKLPGIPSDLRLRKWVRAALMQPAQLTLRIVNAAEGCRLNTAFRGKPYATNVLTFVYHVTNAARLFGDIILCAPVLAAEARAQGKMLRDHYAHMVIHGVLHLSGMDHAKPREAAKMEALEIALLADLEIANPY